MYTVNNIKVEAIGEKGKMFQLLNEIKKIHPYREKWPMKFFQWKTGM